MFLVYKEYVRLKMEIKLWAPPGRSTYEVANKANEWIGKHPNKPPFTRFLQEGFTRVFASGCLKLFFTRVLQEFLQGYFVRGLYKSFTRVFCKSFL